MNKRTLDILSDMTPWERSQYRNHQGMISFLEMIRPKKASTDKERRLEFPDRDQDRC